MGGADAVVAKAAGYVDDGDLRFAAELLNHAVFADDDHARRHASCSPTSTSSSATAPRTARGATSTSRARTSCATGVEAAGASTGGVARHGRRADASSSSSTRIAIRINGPRAWDETLVDRLGVHRPRPHLPHRAVQRRAHPGRRTRADGDVDLTVTLTKAQLLGLLGGGGLDGIDTAGDAGCLQPLLGVLDRPGPDFPIVTP